MSSSGIATPLSSPAQLHYKRRTSPGLTVGTPRLPLSGSQAGPSSPGSNGSFNRQNRPGVSRRSILRTTILATVLIAAAYLFLSGGGETPAVDRRNEASMKEGSQVEDGDEGGQSWFGGLKGSAHGTSLRRPHTHPSVSGDRINAPLEEILDLTEDFPTTSYDGGLAGYSVFSNLYLSAGSLLFVEPDQYPPTDDPSAKARIPLPGVRQIMSGPKTASGGYPAADDEWWRVSGEEVARQELGKRALYLKGVTYIFNDGPGGEGYLVYFKHFVIEAFLGATRVLANILQSEGTIPRSGEAPLPKRIWFPRCGWNPSWRDEKGENAWFIAHALPGVIVEDANGWDDRITAGLPIVFERLVLVDRWSAHSVPGEVSAWGKMNAGAAALSAPQAFWAPIRRNMMRSVGADGPSRAGSRDLPVVVYVDTQMGPQKIREDDRAALIEALKKLTDIAEVHITKLSAMTKAQQVELMSRTEIVIGLHTDDLYTALWMPATDRSTVMELFEEGGFDRSFELLASSLNHRYIAVQNDKVLEEAQWRASGATRGENAKGSLPLNGQLIADLVRGILTAEGKRTGAGIASQTETVS